MNLSIDEWSKFKVSDIFEPFINGKGLTEQEIKDNPGQLAAIQSSSENNACMGFIDEQYCREMKYKIVSQPCLTVARSGSAGFVSFQPNGCVVGDSAKALIIRAKDVNTFHYLFMRTILMRNMYKYTYGRKVKAEQYMDMEIVLPTTVDGDPNWSFMENYIKSLHYKPVVTVINKSLNSVLDISEWREYKLEDLFDIKKGKRLTKADMIEGNDNFLGAISSNNGVREKITADKLWDGNCITVNYNGSVGEAFYQSEPFWASDDVNVLYAKKWWEMNKYNALFIVTVIKANKYRFSYGRKWTMEKMKDTVIKLPSKEDGKPDFEYMERYTRTLPYSDRI